MTMNPKMKVLIQQGYYDLACPYGTVKAAVDRLTITPELRRNVHTEYYEAGHMMYVHPGSMRKFGDTTKAFIDANSN
jgi:carboxypeptidase C (cathepsin A)